MKNISIGTLAHVDAGKTTLSERMLYNAKAIRSFGRVDHKDTFLDYDEQERNRGITIYSKQAIFTWKDLQVTLLDTPGHVDFSAEMERTLQILDYALIVVSAIDGIQSHTETIWNLLKHYQIPTFIFVNKMDITHSTQQELMKEIEDTLSGACVDFTQEETTLYEKISLCDDSLLEAYIQEETLDIKTIQTAIQKRLVFPCFFGSALKSQGVEEFMNAMHTYMCEGAYTNDFGARIFKITRDEQGNKLTHMKIMGGTLSTKEKLGEDEKVDQIRLYSGHKFQSVNRVEAGQICAIKGLKHFVAGEGIGNQHDIQGAMLTSYLTYKVILPQGCDVAGMYRNFLLLAEEDPQLHVRYLEATQEISLQLMGEIQIEVLQHKIKERFHEEVTFDQGSVVYKETICEPVEGVGHFEPLRHYAEVHLLLEPLPRNQGLIFETDCDEDILPRLWQRAVLTHLQEVEHIGVLCGAPITDMKITLLSGKAHLKHTEGGDFRQATYRALRQGLKSTTSMLLEPYYAFKLSVPISDVSRAMHDLQMRNATYELRDGQGDMAILQGSAPVSMMQHYQLELHAYTKGKGRLFCSLEGYQECLKAQDIIEEKQYDSERDIEHPTGSIFCAHGAGFYVPWNEVYQHMHIKACWKKPDIHKQDTNTYRKIHIDDAEVERVMRMTYGERKTQTRNKKSDLQKNPVVIQASKPPCYIVDGYNIIHDWYDLKEMAKEQLDGARDRLIHYMSSFQGYKKCLLILVFDAYKVEANPVSEYYNGSIYIVYTKSAQTADSYIEKTTHELADRYNITVATSDGLEQLIVSGQGARRMSARELQLELEYCQKTTIKEYEQRQTKAGNRALEDLRKLNEQ